MINDGKKENIQDLVMKIEQIDYGSILEIIEPVIAYYISRKICSSILLHKELKPKNISKVLPPPELKEINKEIDVESICAKEFGNTILEFVKVIIENFNPEVLNNFYNNLKTLNVSSKSFVLRNLLFGVEAVGTYDPKHNKIAISTEPDDTTVSHELLHMSSTFYRNGMAYSGFSQRYTKTRLNIGNGINEGYTELLNNRYFDKKMTDSETYRSISTYEYLTIIAEKLEQIVGKEKMERLYFKCSLNGLIQELSQYSSEEEIMKFITDTDFLLRHLDNNGHTLFENNLVTKALKGATLFLISTYARKLIMQAEDGSITFTGITQRTMDYARALPYKFINNNHKSIIIYDYGDILRSVQRGAEPKETAYGSK